MSYLSSHQKKLLKTICLYREMTFKQLSEKSGCSISTTQLETGSIISSGYPSLEFYEYVTLTICDINNKDITIIRPTKAGDERAKKLTLAKS